MTDMQKFIAWVKSKGYDYETSESSDYTFFVQVFVDTYVYEEWEFSMEGAFIDKFVYDVNSEIFNCQPCFYLEFTF